ncbi:Homeobox-containing protein 1 [Triplophysa tibetana]|uniref:Homeobox-containing protein 1 n=1 Tax=Triplophysa tibetana TaxID=1572043 RepID=A0A5A9NRZ8_9TELE|nr:Homeobox-containing protein 1 [Triplophysa tibetana]
MSHYTDEPRFTIEQIDLLQRLRRSGMTKQEILHAMDTLDRLDREHVEKFGHRHANGGNGAGAVASNGSNATTSSNSCTTSSNNLTASSSTTSTATQTGYRGSGLSPSPSNSYDTSPPPAVPTPMQVVVSMVQNGRDVLAAMPNGKLSPPRYAVSNASTRAHGFENTDEDVDIDDKVEELMRSVRNTWLRVRRISQSRISHWLLQQGSDLSEQKKRAFYRWYQLEKTTPGATLAMRPTPMALEDVVEWRQTPPPISSTQGSFRLRRGSRFTWRKECLAVMESYFNDNQYPDEAKREEIANACNAVIQKPEIFQEAQFHHVVHIVHRYVMARSVFFEEAAILESHGIDVQSPGGHSNSDEIDGNDYGEQVAADQVLGMDDTAGQGEHQDPIALAVEMAAVNHSILALARQGGATGDIKTEVLDDE